ncbi:OmpA family protein [uncultured Dialister sp.]|jgi:chemotaxis protein MotB|uniref:OmpA/MotB family protein n=1 Tax=uncultured Dialister sp. TaxID=278064 RepID=UPI0025D4782D|nr:OmpA family protein [uncultured Dialister sp.]
MRKFRNHTSPEADSDAFSTCLSDLMAGLLGVFVLALAYFMLNVGDIQNQYTGNTEKRNAMLKEIQEQMKQYNVSIQIVEDQGIIRIPAGVLFESGEADINGEGAEHINELAQVLYQILQKDDYKGSVDTIFIEGHTDSDPIQNHPRYRSNWDLSTERAINTLTELQNDNADLKNLKNALENPIFSCSGYADTRPVTTEEDRKAENRRIDLRFTMMPPKESKK